MNCRSKEGPVDTCSKWDVWRCTGQCGTACVRYIPAQERGRHRPVRLSVEGSTSQWQCAVPFFRQCFLLLCGGRSPPTPATSRTDDPGLAAIEEHSFCNGNVEVSSCSGGGSISGEEAGNHTPPLLCLLQVGVQSHPVAVIVGEDASQVGEVDASDRACQA
jgi:hypothetical protein